MGKPEEVSRSLIKSVNKLRYRVHLSNVVFTGVMMNHHQIEKDIQHLESVIMRLSVTDRIPLSYWRNRVEAVSTAELVPSQQQRVKRIREAICALEARTNAAN